MNPWLIYPTWQNFSFLFREVTIAGDEKTEFLRYQHLTSSLYYAINFIESLLNEKHRARLESEGKSEDEIVFILRRGSSAAKPKERRYFDEKFSDWPSFICGREIKVSDDLKRILSDFNEVRGHLTHPKSRGYEIYEELEKVNGQELLEAVAEYAITIFNGLGEKYPYWLFGWNYLNVAGKSAGITRINNQQFLHSLDYLGLQTHPFDGTVASEWENANLTSISGYKLISNFLASCREFEPFNPQFPFRPRLVKKWWDADVFEKHKDYVKQRTPPVIWGTCKIRIEIIGPFEITAIPVNKEGKTSNV
jgi:hypothetical protein